MSANQEQLLTQYAATRDAEAFRGIVTQHKDMVYATCKRVLRNAADAEDVTQACFIALAHSPETVRESLAGWLHRTAVGKSIDLIRQDSARRSREAKAMGRTLTDESAAWDEISDALDKAIDSLPDEERLPIIRCYLEGMSQQEAAEELGVTQSAIAKRIQRGVESLQGTLRAGGWLGTAALLITLFATRTADAAPASLTASLGKVAIAGAGSATGATASAKIGGILATKGNIVLASIGVVTVASIAIIAAVSPRPPEHATPPELTTQPVVAIAAKQKPVTEKPQTNAPAVVAEMDPGEAFLREAASKILKGEDNQPITRFFDPDADLMNQGKGSAMKFFEGANSTAILRQITPDELVFFTAKDIPDVSTRFPHRTIWNADRLPSRLIEGASACLLAYTRKAPRQGMAQRALYVFVARRINGEYKIVYVDGN